MTVSARTFVEDAFREDRQERQHGKTEERGRGRENDQRDEHALLTDILQAARQFHPHAFLLRRRDELHPQRNQRVDDDEEGDCVDGEAERHRLLIAESPRRTHR